MNDLIDVLAKSAVNSAHSEMNLAIYQMKRSGLYEKAGDKLNLNEWGMLTSTSALGYIYEFILKRLTEEQRKDAFENCFDRAAVWYFEQTGVPNPNELALACMKALDLQENNSFFNIGKIGCCEQEGLFKHFAPFFGLKYGLLNVKPNA